MAKLKGAALGALGGILATAFFAGTAVVGCGDDTGGTPTGDAGNPDHTSGSSSGSSSSSSGAGSSSSGGASSSSSGAGSSSSGGSSSSSSGGGSDAGDGGARTDADAAVTPADAEAGVPACTTTISQLATGGSDGGTDGGVESGSDAAADTGLDGGLDASVDTGADVEVDAAADATAEAAAPLTPTLLFGFDNGADFGWSGSVNGHTTETGSQGATITDGHSCLGALTLYVTYAAYNVQASITYNYGPPTNWVGRSKIHFWVKVITENYATLQGAQAFVQSDISYSGYRDTNVDISTFADAAWHEIVIDLTPPGADASVDYNPAIVDSIGVQLNAAGSGPDGGPAAPAPATILVDDIWYE